MGQCLSIFQGDVISTVVFQHCTELWCMLRTNSTGTLKSIARFLTFISDSLPLSMPLRNPLYMSITALTLFIPLGFTIYIYKVNVNACVFIVLVFSFKHIPKIHGKNYLESYILYAQTQKLALSWVQKRWLDKISSPFSLIDLAVCFILTYSISTQITYVQMKEFMNELFSRISRNTPFLGCLTLPTWLSLWFFLCLFCYFYFQYMGGWHNILPALDFLLEYSCWNHFLSFFLFK